MIIKDMVNMILGEELYIHIDENVDVYKPREPKEVIEKNTVDEINNKGIEIIISPVININCNNDEDELDKLRNKFLYH